MHCLSVAGWRFLFSILVLMMLPAVASPADAATLSAAEKAAELCKLTAEKQLDVIPDNVASLTASERAELLDDLTSDELKKLKGKLESAKAACDQATLIIDEIIKHAKTIADNRVAIAANAKKCAWKKETFKAFAVRYLSFKRRQARSTKTVRHKLTIESARFGDFRNGHVCDASVYFRTVCQKGRRGETVVATAPTNPTDYAKTQYGDTFCLVRRTPSQTDLCGFDPSPYVAVADKRVVVRYACAGQGRRRNLPGNAAHIDLVCKYPPLKSTSADTAKALEDEHEVYASAPCPMRLKAKKASDKVKK